MCSATATHFNPRSLHGERPYIAITASVTREFQSTLPARGATTRELQKAVTSGDFNPRSLHGERPKPKTSTTSTGHFNPRSLHGERHNTTSLLRSDLPFQSTLPARGATNEVATYIAVERISIHAPCTGSDEKLPVIPTSNYTISIHAPCTGSDRAGFQHWQD